MIPKIASPTADGLKADVAIRRIIFLGERRNLSKDPEVTYSGIFFVPMKIETTSPYESAVNPFMPTIS